jgi:diguanylate cyclase (GGDEF)-like protein
MAILLGLASGAALVILGEQIRTPVEALRRRFIFDSASSALNRRYFQRTLEETIARNDTGNVSLGLIQLEGLKDLIDTLPPVITQQVLHEVTRKLKNELRGNDIVGRWGDVEFAALLPATPIAAAERTLNRIRKALMNPIYITNDSVQLDPYVAVAVSQPQEAVTDLITRAEDALTQARRTHLATRSSNNSGNGYGNKH